VKIKVSVLSGGVVSQLRSWNQIDMSWRDNSTSLKLPRQPNCHCCRL